MPQKFVNILSADGKKNSIKGVSEVVDMVLHDPARLEELYETTHHEDAWVRMRAIDAFEKICRLHPEWIQPYIDRIQKDLSASTQPSIQWHIAEIYMQVGLTKPQKQHAIEWLKKLLGSVDVDWIVAGNSMNALAYFVNKGEVTKNDFRHLLQIQLDHTSKAVKKRAQKFLTEFS